MKHDFDQTPTKTPDGSALRHGTAKTRYVSIPYILPPIAWDDAAIKDAADAGNITTVHYADYNFFQVLGIYSEFEVEVYGE